MGLRDIAVLLAVYGSIPFALKKPFVGVLVWIWLSLMNPHRISWVLGNAQLAQLVAIVMLFSLLISRTEEKKIPWNTITILLALWWFWIFVTTLVASNPSGAWVQWDTVWKVMLTTFVIIMVLNTKERLIVAAMAMMLSIGFFGFKGGFFTLATGGSYRVWGPPGSFLAGNNEIGLALIMILPFVFYARTLANSKWLRLILLIGIFLCFAAIVGTHSRGAFVGVVAMALFLAVRSPSRGAYLILLLVAIPFVIMFMPEHWVERMESMKDYEQDASALGRINAWWMAWHLALDNPVFGAGLQGFTRANFLLYAPDPLRVHDAHSIYFEVLGEQGFVGLVLFLGLGIASLAKAGAIRRETGQIPQLRWMYDLATTVQLSLLGYAVCGLFLGLAYFDFYYMLVALIAGAGLVLEKTKAGSPELFEAGRAESWREIPTFGGRKPTQPHAPASVSAIAVDGRRPRERRPAFSLRGLIQWGLDWYRKI